MRIKEEQHHTFLNVFEFEGRGYVAEAFVTSEEEAISLSIDPEIPGHPDEAIGGRAGGGC